MEKSDYILFKFGSVPDSIRFKRVTNANAFIYFVSVDGYSGTYVNARTTALIAPFDENTITYYSADLPSVYAPYIYTKSVRPSDFPQFVGLNVSDGNTQAAEFQPYGFALYSLGSSYWRVGETLEVQTLGSNRPYLQITVDDSVVVGLTPESLAPSGGSIVKADATTFTWGTSPEFRCLPELQQTSAIFRWRSGSSGAVHEIPVSGAAQSVTVPANTFAGTTSIQWQVAVTANSGVTTTSEWVTLSTADATPTATPLSPVNTVLDGSKANIFEWQHSISTGTLPTKSELQKSADGQTWTTLATIDGSAREWVCPANTLTSSVKYWRVRTYNTDGVSSEWSEAAQIVVIAAPSAPAIQIKSTGPRPVIGWQTSEQEAYQVELDDELSGGTHYGTDKTWKSPTYLSDGSHTVRVRVQNQYGMWSAWGSAALPVANTPGEAITLTVQAGESAALSWQTSGSYGFFLVYRDERPIARVLESAYTDERSVGSVTYRIRGCYLDADNYGLSNEMTVDVRPAVLTVSALETGIELRLPYSDSQHRQTGRTVSRQIELLQLSGAYYPVAVEVDSGTDVLSVTAALTDEGQVRQLMALVGKLVCVKTPQGDLVIGYITSLPKQNDDFLNVFNFTVEQIDYDDEVSL